MQDGKAGEKGVPGRNGLPGQKGEKGEPSMCKLLMVPKQQHIMLSIITILSNASHLCHQPVLDCGGNLVVGDLANIILA